MVHPWKQYQEEAAALFRSLGFDAQTDVSVRGARTTHDIDVLLRSHHAGFDVTWLVECKLWQSKVSKAQVLAFRTIVIETGADRGILLAESGFQSGALEASRLTNVTATSLAGVIESARGEIAALQLRDLYDRIEVCREMYWSIPKGVRIDAGLRPDSGATGYSGTQVIDVVSDLLAKAFRGIFPIQSETVGALLMPDLAESFSTVDELIPRLEQLVAELELKIESCNTN